MYEDTVRWRRKTTWCRCRDRSSVQSGERRCCGCSDNSQLRHSVCSCGIYLRRAHSSTISAGRAWLLGNDTHCGNRCESCRNDDWESWGYRNRRVPNGQRSLELQDEPHSVETTLGRAVGLRLYRFWISSADTLLAKQRPREASGAARAFQGDLFARVGPNFDAFVSQHSLCLRIAGEENALAWSEGQDVASECLRL